MPRYFLEFVNLQNKNKDGKFDSILITIKLYSNSLPKLSEKISKLFFNESKNSITFRKTIVTRIIAPEYLIQFGKSVRRNKSNNMNSFFAPDDFDEIDENFIKNIKGRSGLICLANKRNDIFDSIELCIVFVPWGKYQELEGYTVIGECKEWKDLRNWMSQINVKESISQSNSYEIPTGDGVWVNRCGRLLENKDTIKSKSKRQNDDGNTNNSKSNGKIKAVDLMFKKRRRK